MNKEQIQKQIDDAVRVFRETLEINYLKKNIPFYGIGIHKYDRLLCGNVSIQRKINGNVRISGDLGKDMIRSSCNGMPITINDWAIYPLAITIFQDNISDKPVEGVK